MPCTDHVKYRIVQNVYASRFLKVSPHRKSIHGPFYFPPNQLETPVLAWLAFSSTFLSNLSISWMVAALASFAYAAALSLPFWSSAWVLASCRASLSQLGELSGCIGWVEE